jgi:hypothetical protein
VLTSTSRAEAYTADSDLTLQLIRTAQLLLKATGTSLNTLIDRGARWDLGRHQSLFRSLEQFVMLAGGPALPACPGRATTAQLGAFVAFVAAVAAGVPLPPQRPSSSEVARRIRH